MASPATVNSWLRRQVRAMNALLGMGYGVREGAGAVVVQATSRATAVTIDKFAGRITLFAAAGSTVAASFTVNNAKIKATDTVLLAQLAGTDRYEFDVTKVADGSFEITFQTKSGTTVEAISINFAIVRSAID